MNIRVAGGGVIFRISRLGSMSVALIKRNGFWDLPKGQREDSESIAACAAREVAEEMGIPTPSIISYLVETQHEFERGGKEYQKITHWFSMVETTEVVFQPQEEEGITECCWMELSLAKEKVGFENLKIVLNHFESSLL